MRKNQDENPPVEDDPENVALTVRALIDKHIRNRIQVAQGGEFLPPASARSSARSVP